jgi:hypothetical protein
MIGMKHSGIAPPLAASNNPASDSFPKGNN